MANICFSWIKIRGDKDTIKMITNVINKSKPKEDLFLSFIGIPEHMSEKEFKEGGHYLNWIGTNSGWFNDTDINFYDEEITISMESRWSPPDDFIKTFSKMYKVNCTIEYEESTSFCGKTTCTWDGDHLDIVVEDYDYLEGVYILRDNFWDEVEFYLEYIGEEDQTLDEFLNQFPFVSDVDKEELTILYNQEKEKYETKDRTEGE